MTAATADAARAAAKRDLAAADRAAAHRDFYAANAARRLPRLPSRGGSQRCQTLSGICTNRGCPVRGSRQRSAVTPRMIPRKRAPEARSYVRPLFVVDRRARQNDDDHRWVHRHPPRAAASAS